MQDTIYQQMSIFEFGNNDKGEYVNFEEENEKNWHNYPLEEIIKGHELEDDFVVCATFHTGCLSQYGMTIEDIQKEIKTEVESKTYHYGNLAKDIYAYSYKVCLSDIDLMYWFVIENPKYIVVVNHYGNIDTLLKGEETICYPACACYLFEKTETGVKKISSGYGNYKDDIRYKVLCEEFKILEFSKNRIDPKKKPIDFYEAEYRLEDFINYWGEEK